MHPCVRHVFCGLGVRLKWFALIIAVVSALGCNGIVSPKKDQCVQVGSVEVRWTPETKPMVVQYYQNEGCLLNCGPKPPHAWSGSRIEIPTTAKTEINIWEPGASKPFDSVWVYIEKVCPGAS